MFNFDRRENVLKKGKELHKSQEQTPFFLCQLIKDLPIKDSEVIRFIEKKVGAIS